MHKNYNSGTLYLHFHWLHSTVHWKGLEDVHWKQREAGILLWKIFIVVLRFSVARNIGGDSDV